METSNTGNTFTFTFERKNKHRRFVVRQDHCAVRQQILAIQQKSYCIDTAKYWFSAIFCGIDTVNDKNCLKK